METYNGHVRTPTDAIILFEACRLGLLPRVQRRLSEKERQSIRSGSVFVWDEREAGMRRWTDGKSWSASRVSGSFLTYREMEGKRGGNHFVTPAVSRGAKTPDSGRNSAEEPADGEEGPDGYRYKPDGLMKQSFSITTNSNQHLHLISYYSRSHPTAPNLRQPSTDPSLSSIQIPKGMYPESSVTDQSDTPAVTRSPMPGAPNYAMAQSPTYARPPPPPPPAYPHYPGGYIYHPNGYMYPISPMPTPPGPFAPHPAYAHAHAHAHAHAPHGLPPLGHPPSPYGPPPPPPLNHAPSLQYDQRPTRGSMSSAAPPAPPTTLQHSVSAPAVPHLARPPSPRGPPVAGQCSVPAMAETNSASMSQIDPRLTQADSMAAQAQGGTSPRRVDGAKTNQASGAVVPTTTASQIPAIGSLVNSAQLPPGPAGNDEDHQQRGKASPGRGQESVRPQDIPSEKLGFKEDMRVLSKLDRVFTRV